MITWTETIESAIARARGGKNLVLVDFFHPQ